MDDAPDPSWCRHQIVEAARLAGFDFPDQQSALPSFVHLPDEVIIGVEEARRFAPRAHSAGSITSDQLALVIEIDQLLDALPVDQDYPAALRQMESASEWATLRMKARALLTALGEELGPPDPGTVVYV